MSKTGSMRSTELSALTNAVLRVYVPQTYSSIIMESPFTSFFDTNYVPTDDELAQVQSLVQGYETVVDELNEEIEPIKAKLSALLQQRKTYKDLIFKHRNLISVVRRLPSDVLSTIFLLCLPDSRDLSFRMRSNHPSVVLSHVCQRWRHIALETPFLWATISIVLPNYQGVPEVENGEEAGSEGMSEDSRIHLNRWLDKARLIRDVAQVWLLRAGSSPIMLKFYASDVLNVHKSIQRTPQPVLSALRDLVDLACGACERWQELEFQVTVTDCEESPLCRLLLVPAENLPHLEKVYITFSQPHATQTIGPPQDVPGPRVLEPSRIGLLNAKQLRYLDIVPPSDVRIIEWTRSWSSLVDLRLLGFTLMDIPGEEFLVLLQQCSNLVFAEFEMPVLRSIVTDGNNVETTIPNDHPAVVCPNLRVLKFRRGLPPPVVPLSLSLPSLRSLTVEYTLSSYLNGEERFMPWIIQFGETLTTLQLNSFLPNPTDLHRCVNELLPNLTTLKIGTIPEYLGPITKVLFPILSKFVPLQSDEGQAVGESKRSLPKLERISCEAAFQALWTERQVIQFITSRRSVGGCALEACSPIRHVKIAFPYAKTIDVWSSLAEANVDVDGLHVNFVYPSAPVYMRLIPT